MTNFHFGLLFSNPMFLLFLQLPEKKVLDPNGPYISTFQTIPRNVCLSVIFFLSVVVVVGVLCSASTAYTGLFRGLKYLLKVRYIIPNHPNVARFLIFETFFEQSKNIGLCLNLSEKYIKNFKGHLSLVKHSFTKLSNNVCLINTHILIH